MIIIVHIFINNTSYTNSATIDRQKSLNVKKLVTTYV